MFTYPSLWSRVAICKSIGFLLTGGCVLLLPGLFAGLSWHTQLGFVLWYTTLGAFVGLFGVLNYHPMLQLALPWWFRGPWLGGWMNLILALFIWDQLAGFQAGFFGPGSALASPWWFVAEGIVLGAFMDWTATRFGGEGPACVGTPAAAT